MMEGVVPGGPAPAPPWPPREERPAAGAGFLALVLAAGAFAVVLANVPADFFELERHAAPKELALHATALLCLASLLPRWRSIAPGIVTALLALFVLWSAGSALLAVNRWLSLSAAGVSLSGLVLLVAAQRVARAPHARRAALAGLAGAALLAAGLGAAQAYGLDAKWLAADRPPGGTFGNRNFLAHVLAMTVPPVLLAAVRARRRRAAALAALTLAVMCGVIVLTRSRAAWLGLGASLTVMTAAALLARRAHRGLVRARRLTLVTATLAAAAVLATLLPNRLEWRSDSPYVETLTRLTDYGGGSGRGRLIQWANSLRMFREAPVQGVGPGNWFVAYPRVTSPGDPSYAGADPIPTNPWPSSDWIAMLAERGAVGTLILLLTGLAATIAALRRIVLRRDPPLPVDAGFDPDAARAARAIAALGVITATFVTGLFDAVLLLAAPTYFAWTSLGLLLPPTRPVLERPLAGRARRVILAATAACALGLTLYAGLRTAALVVVGDRPDRARLETAARLDPGGHRVLLRLARTGRCTDRIPAARATARLMPHHAAPQRALRACGVRE